MAQSEVPVVIPTEVIDGLTEEAPQPAAGEVAGADPVVEGESRATEAIEEAPATSPETTPEPEVAPEPPILELIHDTLGEVKALRERQDRPVESAPEEERPIDVAPAIKALLEHDDPTLRLLGEQLQREAQQTAERIGQLEADLGGTQQVLATAQALAEIEPAAEKYGLTEQQVQFVVDSMDRSGTARSLTFEQGVRAFLPDAKPRTATAPPPPPAPKVTVKPNGAVPRPGAPLVDRAAAAGAVPKETNSKEFASVEDAVGEGWPKLFPGA